ncbi:pseudouridine synthase [Paracoccaceae bacterium Fryx2]|nr:pseudouridine synthase [Paracoccaceae bacterium Fryx2]
MTDPAKPAPPPAPPKAPAGERIAKVLSRAGIASRREAERMIELGQVAVNGRVIDSPALNVTPQDRITVEGKPVAAPEPARLWLYYKPEGLVTSASDEKGRATVFERLPEDMPRVMSIGRLDLNSEGLLLLTNDGELKRRLELPATGWLRKYRVRIKGNPTDADLEPLRTGITVEGERFQPMIAIIDRIQGANAWLTIGLREGKNREIRRAMFALNLTVNRLIRVSYGPFRLGDMEPGDVAEVRGKVLRDQLGYDPTEDDAPEIKGAKPRLRPKPGGGDAEARPARPGGTKPRLLPKAKPTGRPTRAAGPAERAAAATPKPQTRTPRGPATPRTALPAEDPAKPQRGPKSRSGAAPRKPAPKGPPRGPAKR